MGLPADFLSRPASKSDRHARPPPTAAPRLTWVPVRSLAERHRPRILSHLLALPEHDRYLRFGYSASDRQVARYADLIDFSQDEVFGIFNRRLELIAQAHLAAAPGCNEAEFAVSVLPSGRGRGYGGRLFEHAMLHARNRGIDALIVHVLAENTPMLRIARRFGATVERQGGEASAKLRLPPGTLRSHLDAFVEDGAAELDYRLKAQRQRIASVIDGLLQQSTDAQGESHRRTKGEN